MGARGRLSPQRSVLRAGQVPRAARGFSLLELMIVVAIVAIIAAVAIPNYQEHSKNGRRATAAAALIDATSRQEQFFLDNKTYTTTIIAGGLNMAVVTEGGSYGLSVDIPTGACPVIRCFRVRATPQGAQVGDRCGTMTINSDRIKTPSGCW